MKEYEIYLIGHTYVGNKVKNNNKFVKGQEKK